MPQPTVIDLSHHNIVPDGLHDAAASGIVGVIHKLTEGLGYTDRLAEHRYQLAKDSGLLFGAYHFLRPGKIIDQANYFLSKLPDDDNILLILDFEVAGIPLSDVLAWLMYVEQTAEQKPVLYAGNVLKELGGASKVKALANYRLWIAQYNNTGPTVPKGYKDWWLWQYSEEGSVPGIHGNVDVNAYQGTDLRQDWVIRTSASVPAVNPTGSDPAVVENVVNSANTSENPQTPITSTVEQTTKQVSVTDGQSSVTEQKTITQIAKGDAPGDPPTQVSRNGPLAKWLFSGGGLASIGTMLLGFVQNNLSVIGIGIICLTLLIIVLIFRGAITDAIRMTTAADTDKKNVT